MGPLIAEINKLIWNSRWDAIAQRNCEENKEAL